MLLLARAEVTRHKPRATSRKPHAATYAAQEMMLEAKRPLQRQLQAELSSCTEAAAGGIRAAFASREAAIEHDIDFKCRHSSVAV